MGKAPGSDRRYRVLVVDDDESVLASTAAVLSMDVDVVTAASAEQALRLLRAETFDVVCTDFKMSGMDGVELLQRVSELPYAVGCLLITGNDGYFRAESQSQHYVLLKPYEPERLIRLVLQLARIARMKRSMSSSPEPSSSPPPPTPSTPVPPSAGKSSRPPGSSRK